MSDIDDGEPDNNRESGAPAAESKRRRRRRLKDIPEEPLKGRDYMRAAGRLIAVVGVAAVGDRSWMLEVRKQRRSRATAAALLLAFCNSP